MGTYIRTLRLSDQASVLELAYPEASNSGGTINVICGPNNAGKSYLLQQIRKVLTKTWGVEGSQLRPGLQISCTGNKQPYVVSFDESSRHKSKAGTVFVGFKSARVTTSQNTPAYRRISLLFLLQNVNAHLPPAERIESTEHLDYMELRRHTIERFELGSLYLCERGNPVVAQLETVLDATLYFRRSKQEEAGHHWEFALSYGDRKPVGYSEWSEGQQASFYLITHIAFGNPDIVLLDEIENHLHPAYITRLLEFLRMNERQSIITTHHPHVIFSERVDRVIYLDTPRPARIESPAEVLRDSDNRSPKWPEPKVVTLEDAFELVTHAYKLFDLHDAQLFRQASRITSEADVELYRMLYEIYSHDVKPATGRVFPDRQSMQLVERIRSFVAEAPESGPVAVLDLGAGLGRVATEVSKLSRWQQGSRIRWICWEPIETNRSRLKETLSAHSIAAELPVTPEEVPDGSVQVALIANVLHELTPDEFTALIRMADKKIEPASGSIIILELHPLLHSEKYAVPYPASILQGILNDSGFTTDCETVPVGGGAATAYCILCRRADVEMRPDKDTLRRTVEKAWDRLQRDAIAAYANRRALRSFAQYASLVQDMTVIASVAAWRQGFWVSGNPK